MTRTLSSIAACIAFIAVANSVASAESYGHFMGRACYNGKTLAELFNKADEATAMLDESRYQTYKELALQSYRCSANASDPYLHDVAAYFYSLYLYLSLRTNGDEDQNGPLVSSRLNDLAAATRFSDIRAMSLKLKKQVIAATKAAHTAIYGASEPSPPEDTPTPDTEDTPQPQV